MNYDRKKINDHPAHQRADDGLTLARRSSYYVQVLRQNLHHFFDQVPVDPCEVDEQEVLRGTVFMVEEAIEYSSSKTLEGKFDALVDIVIVALGRAVFHGFHHFDAAVARVIEANKQKIPGPSPGRGEWSRDLSKPKDWEPAYLTDLVQSPSITALAASAGLALHGQANDEPLDENETEILEGFKRRCASKSISEIEYLVRERERLIVDASNHDERENLSARVITRLRKKVTDLMTERDQANLDWGTISDKLCQEMIEREGAQAALIKDREERNEVRSERDEYQRQLRDEIARCHALRGSNHNLRTRLFETGVANEKMAAPTCVDLASPMLTETLQRVISLRKRLKSQVFTESMDMTSAERDRQRLIFQAESVLADVELNADSPMRVPIQVEYASKAGEEWEVSGAEESSIKLDQVHPVLLECAQLLVKKAQDYGSSMTDYSKSEYMPFGHYSYIHMLHTKLSRIRSIALESDPERKTNFESLRDSVIDLINYAAFYAAWLDEQETTSV